MFYGLNVFLPPKAQYLRQENDSDIQMPHLSKELNYQRKNANKTTFKGLT